MATRRETIAVESCGCAATSNGPFPFRWLSCSRLRCSRNIPNPRHRRRPHRRRRRGFPNRLRTTIHCPNCLRSTCRYRNNRKFEKSMSRNHVTFRIRTTHGRVHLNARRNVSYSIVVNFDVHAYTVFFFFFIYIQTHTKSHTPPPQALTVVIIDRCHRGLAFQQHRVHVK